jgi:hypothetical protein
MNCSVVEKEKRKVCEKEPEAPSGHVSTIEHTAFEHISWQLQRLFLDKALLFSHDIWTRGLRCRNCHQTSPQNPHRSPH